MPKAELHLHLDGSLRVDTALELARTRGIDAPRDWAGMSAALIAPMPCADQAELLRAFDLPIALMQDAEALERITAELVETKAADGVRYVEIRWGPLLHVAGGLSLGRRDRGRVRRRRGRGATGPGPSCGSSAPRCARTTPRRTSRLAETAARFRDAGADRLGPGRARGGLSRIRWSTPRRSMRRASRRPADHAPRRRVGRRGPGPPRARGRSGADRARTRRGRRPGAVRRADHARA